MIVDPIITFNAPSGRYLTTGLARYRFGREHLGESEAAARLAAFGRTDIEPARIIRRDAIRSALSADELARRIPGRELAQIRMKEAA